MSANIMDGKAVARNIREGLKEEVEGLKKKGIHPGLAVVLVGENPASMVYVKNKGEACRSAGIYSEEHKLPAETKEADLLGLINQLNKDPRIHGILVQLPLPAHINKDRMAYWSSCPCRPISTRTASLPQYRRRRMWTAFMRSTWGGS